MTNEPRLTDAEAEEMRAKLSRHYRDQVVTVSEVNAALRTWTDAAAEYLEKQYSITPELVNTAFLLAHKSSLLGRILYGRERLRTKPCPECKGRWCGCFLKCPCGGCGWLAEETPKVTP